MRLEEGKRYWMRNGNVTDPLMAVTLDDGQRIFIDGTGDCWDIEGNEYPFHTSAFEDDFEIINEYADEDDFEIINEYAESMEDSFTFGGMKTYSGKSMEVYSKSTSITDNLPSEHMKALDEMLIKLYKHEITDSTFRMFLNGMISNLNLHF